jgi:hypothetical protein
MVKCLGNEKIDTLVNRPPDLFFKHTADHLIRRAVVGIVLPGVIDVACYQCIPFGGNLARQPDSLPIQVFQQVLLTDSAHFGAVAVIRKRHDDLSPRAQEFAVKLLDSLRRIQHHFRHIGPRRYPPAPFEFEEIPFRAENRSLF